MLPDLTAALIWTAQYRDKVAANRGRKGSRQLRKRTAWAIAKGLIK